MTSGESKNKLAKELTDLLTTVGFSAATFSHANQGASLLSIATESGWKVVLASELLRKECFIFSSTFFASWSKDRWSLVYSKSNPT